MVAASVLLWLLRCGGTADGDWESGEEELGLNWEWGW